MARIATHRFEITSLKCATISSRTIPGKLYYTNNQRWVRIPVDLCVPLWSRVPISCSYATECMCRKHCTAITPPRHLSAVYEYSGGKPVWGKTRISSTIPPFTFPLSTRHNCVMSSQEREFSVPILLRSAFPRS